MTEQPTTKAQNIFLWVGITLPFLLMLFVLVYKNVIMLDIPDPRFAPVYAVNVDYSAPNITARIVNNKLDVILDVPKLPNTAMKDQYLARQKLKIYVWRDIKGAPEEYAFTPSDTQVQAVLKSPQQTIHFDLPPSLDMPLIDSSIAPDGYEFHPYSYDNDFGVIPALMVGTNRNRYNNFIKKDHRAIQLPSTEPNRWSLRFIGWVTQPVKP